MKNSKIIMPLIAVLVSSFVSIDAMGRFPGLLKGAKNPRVATLSRQKKGFPFINVPCEDTGHTHLFDTLMEPDVSIGEIKNLQKKGAHVNARDIYVLGNMRYLQHMLNMDPRKNPSVVTTQKIYRTFMTKNSDQKLTEKLHDNKIDESRRNEIEERKIKLTNIFKNTGLFADQCSAKKSCVHTKKSPTKVS